MEPLIVGLPVYNTGTIVPIAPIGVVLPICSTNKYRVSGPIDFYEGSITPVGAISTIAPHLLVV